MCKKYPGGLTFVNSSMKLDRKSLACALAHLQCGKWHAAHEIVQKDTESPLACWAHGIAHLMEGDVANARYWYGVAERPIDLEVVDVAAEIAALSESLRR